MLDASKFRPMEGAPDHYLSPDGSLYVCRPGQTIEELLAEIAAEPPEPAPARVVTYLQFRALFTAGELAAILTAAQSNHIVLDWLLQAAGTGEIDLGSPLTAAGLDALIAADLLAPGRKPQILAAEAPPS